MAQTSTAFSIGKEMLQDRADGGAGDKIGNRWIVGFDKERIEKELGIG